MSSILDAYTLKTIEDQSLYGRERLWGAVSWAGASIVMGFAMDTMNDPLGVCMIFLVVSTLLSLLLLQVMPDERNGAIRATTVPLDSEEAEQEQQRSNETSLRMKPAGPTSPSLWSLWHRDPKVIVFFYVVLVMGAATSIVENLLFLFMRKDLQASYTLCGVSVVITVMFEIPLFFAGKSLLASIGTLRLLLIGMGCYFTRVVGYTLIQVPWTVLLLGESFATLKYMTELTSRLSRHMKSPSTASRLHRCRPPRSLLFTPDVPRIA